MGVWGPWGEDICQKVVETFYHEVVVEASCHMVEVNECPCEGVGDVAFQAVASLGVVFCLEGARVCLDLMVNPYIRLPYALV